MTEQEKQKLLDSIDQIVSERVEIYEHLVRDGRMRRDLADREIELMREVLRDYFEREVMS